MSIRHLQDEAAIVAQCTPRGSGALAIIRISGANAIEVANKMALLASAKPLVEQPTHTIHAGWVVDQGAVKVDQVMFLLMTGPRTFTGQNTVEITCHNNPFICERIIELAIMHGARLAQEGEFTRRAYLNNKIDLLQAEAINELIHANTSFALKKSLAQLDGSFSSWIGKLEQSLVKMLAYSEASFEFIEDELTFGQEMLELICNVLDDVSTIKKSFNAQNQIRQGIRIAIIGSVNAGKSSLFNAILNRSRAIVTPTPGTTRDVIEAGMYINGNYWTLIDTAGLRSTDDVIEQEGIKRAHEEAHAADVILLVFDSARELTAAELATYRELLGKYENKIIVIANKADLTVQVTHPLVAQSTLAVSTTTRHNIPELQTLIEGKIAALLNAVQSPFLLNQRQYNLLLGLEQKLFIIKSMLSGEIEYELVSYELREAIANLSELTGKSISEQAIDQVFKSFCIGK
jgi:tRNA modification GTPase